MGPGTEQPVVGIEPRVSNIGKVYKIDMTYYQSLLIHPSALLPRILF